MRRWTFHILTLLSLVLMIASCVAWVRIASSQVSIVRAGGSGVITMEYEGRAAI